MVHGSGRALSPGAGSCGLKDDMSATPLLSGVRKRTLVGRRSSEGGSHFALPKASIVCVRISPFIGTKVPLFLDSRAPEVKLEPRSICALGSACDREHPEMLLHESRSTSMVALSGPVTPVRRDILARRG